MKDKALHGANRQSQAHKYTYCIGAILEHAVVKKVSKMLESSKMEKSPGPDEMYPMLLWKAIAKDLLGPQARCQITRRQHIGSLRIPEVQ